MQRLLGAVGALNDDALEYVLHVGAEAVQILSAQGRLLGEFSLGEADGFFLSSQFIDAFNLFMLHGKYLLRKGDGRMIEGKWYAPGSGLDEVLPIRQAVLRRGQDATDALAWNVAVRQAGVSCATGRLWWQDGAFWLGEMAVLPEHRHQGLGDLILRLLLFKAQSHAARMIRLECQPGLTGFFARLGFQVEQADASAVTMALPGDRICLDTCQGCRKDCPNRR